LDVLFGGLEAPTVAWVYEGLRKNIVQFYFSKIVVFSN
jgi:hypothetical protein